MMGTDMGEVGIILEGHLEDMLPSEAAEVEGITHAGRFASRPGNASSSAVLCITDV